MDKLFLSEVEKIIEKSAFTLTDEIRVAYLDDCAEITFPFLDHANDYTQVYLSKREGFIVLSDDGFIRNTGELFGIEWTEEFEKNLLRNLGVEDLSFEKDELALICTEEEAANKLFLYAQTLQKADLFLTVIRDQKGRSLWKN